MAGASRPRARGAVLAQVVILEVALALAAGGLAGGGAWRIAGPAAGVVLALGAFVPVQRRWLYQVVLSWLGLRLRRRPRGGTGLAGLTGPYTVETVAGGAAAPPLGVVRSGTTWCLPLLLGLDGVFNDDAPVPVRALASLLQVEDVPLASVRLFTMTTPAQVPSDAPAGPAAALTPLAARYCLITLDTERAADAVAARGGSEAAVHQILRRCAVTAEQRLAAVGLHVRRLGATAVEGLFATWLGPASPAGGRRGGQADETWSQVRVAGTWSTVFAVSGRGDDVLDRVARLAAVAPTPLAATTLVLRPGRAARAGGASVGPVTSARQGGGPGRDRTGRDRTGRDRAGSAASDVDATMLLRISAPDGYPHGDAVASLRLVSAALGLVVQRLGGEQRALLAATTPLGVGARR